MADTSNLTNFLGDIADAIRTKKETTEPIPAENFDQEILSIEGGIDTSDATASASDIIAPKTAYTAAGKITGTIIPTYEPEETLILDEYTIECDTTSTGDISRLLAVTEDGKWLLAPALTIEGEHGLGVFSVINGNITLIKAYSFSYLGMTDVNYSLFSLSKSIGDNKRILWYTNVGSNILNARIIDFDNTINPIQDTVHTYTTNGVIKNIVVNPNLSNQVFVARYENNYVQWILICGFDIDTDSIITVYPEKQLNLWNASRFHPIHVSADGAKVVFGGANTGERAYDTYLFSLDSSTGRILSTKQFYGSSGDTGLSPDGKYALSSHNFFKLDGINYTQLGTTMWARSTQHGYMFVGASNHIVTASSDEVVVYDINLNTGNQNNKLFDIYTNGVANNVTNQNELWMLSSDRTKIKRIYSNLMLSGFKRNGVDYLDTSNATATASDVLSTKTAYLSGGKVLGTMPNNGELNYTPTTEEQTIPAGYTSGGIISAAALSVDDYKNCLTLTKSILAGTPIYTELKYVQNQNTNQYIDTNVIATSNIEFEIKYNHVSKNASFETIIGGQKNSPDTGLYIMNTCDGTNSKKALRYNSTENKANSSYTFFNEDVVATLKNNVYTFTSNSGTQSFTVGSVSSFNSGRSLWIFALNNGGNLFGGALMRLYYLKIWDNGELVRDYIPVMDYNKKIGIYDKVNEKYYYPNSGVLTSGGVI